MLGAHWSVQYGGVCEIRYHVVWCPKYRRPVVQGAIASRLKELLRDCRAALGAEMRELAMHPDHVHLFLQMPTPSLPPAHIASHLQGHTSRVLRRGFAAVRRRPPTLGSRSRRNGRAGQQGDY
jgi:putative transposase